MTFSDWLRIVHPTLAVIVVYPLLGIVIYQAWLTRQRRIQTKAGEKSKIPAGSGSTHVQMGRWLAGSVTGLALLGLTHPIFKTILKNQTWQKMPGKVIFIVLMFAATISSLALLYRAQDKLWRAIFAGLTSAGLIILGSQDGVFRLSEEWYISHYYYGITAAILMIVSLTILPEIHRHLSWRRLHVALNIIALLLFLAQGITGTRDLLGIPLSWQESTVFGCDFVKQVCGTPP
jgi:ABC-type multidrug transport system permease subunit